MPLALKPALFIVRLTLTAFLAVWVVEKFIEPATTVAIWKAFYLVENLPLEASYAIGVVQGLALIGFALGALKFWTYGFWLVSHGVGTVLTWERLIDPYNGGNHLFWAAVPTFGAFLILFLLRKEDTLLAISRS